MSQVKTSKLSRRMLGWFLIGNIAILPVAALVSLMTFGLMGSNVMSGRPSIVSALSVFVVPIVEFIAFFVGFEALKSHFTQKDFINAEGLYK
jgi:uncharacterized membrane protein